MAKPKIVNILLKTRTFRLSDVLTEEHLARMENSLADAISREREKLLTRIRVNMPLDDRCNPPRKFGSRGLHREGDELVWDAEWMEPDLNDHDSDVIDVEPIKVEDDPDECPIRLQIT